MELTRFNSAGREDILRALRPCLNIDRWVEQLADARPFPSKDALLRLAGEAAEPFTPQEIRQALAHHPRIGNPPQAAARAADLSQSEALSRSEQGGVDVDDDELAAALAQGNREYEKKFGRIFLIRAAGRTGLEILAALRERLNHTPEEEDLIVARQLREIAVLRLEGVMTE
jgi:2-oxo-4-hydroxy-4-carboxy-5-ureidoimidazoline decarboxylase